MPVAPDAFEPNENDALIEIAIAMVEHGGVDWNEVLQSPLATDSGDLRDLIERLRVVDRIVSGHDMLQSSRPATAVSAGRMAQFDGQGEEEPGGGAVGSAGRAERRSRQRIVRVGLSRVGSEAGA